MADENQGADEAQAVTGRPNDIPIRDPEPAPLGGNSTLTSRAKARQSADRKKVAADDAEDKSVQSAQTKSRKSK